MLPFTCWQTQTDSWDADNDKDSNVDESNYEFDDEEGEFEHEYLFVSYEQQVTRKAKWVHQCFNLFACVKTLEQEKFLHSHTTCPLKPLQHL